MLYFGYGSNLNLDDLRRWAAANGHAVAGIRPLEAAWLPDTELVFHYESRARGGGALSVRPRMGASVSGFLFEVDRAGWSALDAKEGVPRFYRREPCVSINAAGDEIPASTYVVSTPRRCDHHVPPTDAYLAVVAAGLAQLGLRDDELRAAARGFDAPAHPSAVFVYGTLRRGQCRAALLQRHAPTRWEPASAPGSLLDLGPYPGWVPGPGRIAGERVEVRDLGGLLAELDEVEDFLGYGIEGSLYRRILVDAETPGGVPELAWAYRYVGPSDGVAALASGDWTRR